MDVHRYSPVHLLSCGGCTMNVFDRYKCSLYLSAWQVMKNEENCVSDRHSVCYISAFL